MKHLFYRYFFVWVSCGFLCCAFSVSAQNPGQWDKTFGSSNNDKLMETIATEDGGYLLAGRFQSSAGEDFRIIKVDKNDEKQWDKAIGGKADDLLTTVVATDDGGFLLGGYSNSDASGDKSGNSQGGTDYWIVKIDKNGNRQWDKTLGGHDDEQLAEIVAVHDGYLLAGTSASDASGYKSSDSKGFQDYWIVKVDKRGNQQWDKTLGGDESDELATVIPTKDGDYFLGGSSFSSASGDKSEGNKGYDFTYDYWIVKVDKNGNKLWDKTLGGQDSDHLTSVIATDDEGYLLAGSSVSNASGDRSEDNKYFCSYDLYNCYPDYWIVKVDHQGNEQWDKAFGGFFHDNLADVTASPDGGYLLAGTSSSRATADKSEGSKGGSDYWVIKIDNGGRKIWDKTLGSNGNDDLSSIITTNGAYLLAGTSDGNASADKSEESKGGSDFWIIRQELAVNTITLVDAENNQDVYTLKDGDAVNLALLENRPLNFRANTFPMKPGSVKFVLEGPVSHEQTENYYPYALFGDDPGLDYHGRPFIPGAYTLTATPYEQADLKGKAGSPLTVHFTVEDQIIVEELRFYIATTGWSDIFTVEDGEVIDLTEFANTDLTLVAIMYPREIPKVKFALEGPFNHERVDEDLPFSLFGDDSFGEFYLDLEGRRWLPGKYKLTITPYTLYGPATPHTISFEIRSGVKVTGLTLVDATTDEATTPLRDGDVVHLSDYKDQKFTVRANTDPVQVNQVTFELSGPIVYISTERHYPYALFGDEPAKNNPSGNRDYTGLAWLPGDYTLKVTPYHDNSTGTPYTVSFSVTGNTNTRLEPLQVEVYPVPTTGIVHISHTTGTKEAHMMLLDFSGNVLLTKPISGQTIEQLDLSAYKKGMYYLKVVDKEKVEVKRVVVE